MGLPTAHVPHPCPSLQSTRKTHTDSCESRCTRWAGPRRRGYLFADDATFSLPGVKRAWQELVDDGKLETLYCTLGRPRLSHCREDGSPPSIRCWTLCAFQISTSSNISTSPGKFPFEALGQIVCCIVRYIGTLATLAGPLYFNPTWATFAEHPAEANIAPENIQNIFFDKG